MSTLTSDGVDRARPRKTGSRPSGSRSSGQLEHLTAQLADLLALLSGQQVTAATLVGFDLAHVGISFRQADPGIEVSVKPGMAHARLDENSWERIEAKQGLREAGAACTEALRLEQSGRTSAALDAWQKLFGPRFAKS